MKTILIITANDPEGKLKLAREANDIQFLLHNAVRKNYEVVLIPEATTEDIIKALNVADREVEVLHYAGHANSTALRLNDTNAKAQALAEKLKSSATLKLVFINGCASKEQVQFFHQADIPFVVATARPIEDEKAAWVATQFYQYLSLGRPVREAFEEMLKDADLGNKNITFGGQRGVMYDLEDTLTDTFDWGLYIREGDEDSNYTLPLSARMVVNTEGVNHTFFLDKLIFALESVDSPHLKAIKNLAANLKRSPVANGKKISELLRAMPYTLGIRIRKISADPMDKDSEYYRKLLYDYVFLYETLLHHTASILTAHLWQHYKTALQHKPADFDQIIGFWYKNRLEAAPFEYKSLIVRLYDWIKKAGINYSCLNEDTEEGKMKSKNNLFSNEYTEGILAYLNSAGFDKAAAYFLQQKRFFSQRVRLNENETLDNCFVAQQHLIVAFQTLKCLTAYIMTSVRGIHVINFRHVTKEYGNLVSKLVVAETDPTLVFSPEKLENKSILCYTTDDSDLENLKDIEVEKNTLTLFPFVIDRNVFTEKSNTEVDLYLFIGYFADASGQVKYHFASVQTPDKVWQFDEKEHHLNLLHIGETESEAHQANHLMANAGEFKAYLTEFKNIFLNT